MRILFFPRAMLLVAAGCSSSPSPVVPPPPLQLDGTRWTVTVSPDVVTAKKGEKTFEDTLIFENGTVTMTECARNGFKASPYNVWRAGDALSFTTQQESEKEGVAFWNGEIKESSIRGTLTWRKKDGTSLQFAFEGK